MRHYACGNNAALTADQAQFIDDEYLSKPRTKRMSQSRRGSAFAEP